jgi:hypothetical protein
LGLKALVLTERADAADVEAVAKDWSMVGDAKAFRLSRTAKNQKDFKIEAMHGWKAGRAHALVLCPSYQLPMRTSQIYEQAIRRDVTILSYAHMAALVALRDTAKDGQAVSALHAAMRCAEDQSPTKDAVFYWTLVNRSMISVAPSLIEHWKDEKAAIHETLAAAKAEALAALAAERDRIQRMSHEAAVAELIHRRNLDKRAAVIRSISGNELLGLR